MIWRVLGGALLAAGIARLAGQRGHLAPSGARAAVVVGTLAVAAGWGWGALLIAYFAASSALTAFGRARKAARTADSLADSHSRSARQVLANGGVFAGCAALGATVSVPALSVAAAGALAAAAADTWATEVGTLWGGTPRSLRTGRAIPPGLSGGVTAAGLAASGLAALLVAVPGAWLLGARDPAAALWGITAAGVVGSAADSVLGAFVQLRRRCAACDRLTERPDHCGLPTRHVAGWRWMTNDTVNLFATAVGALVAVALVPSLS